MTNLVAQSVVCIILAFCQNVAEMSLPSYFPGFWKNQLVNFTLLSNHRQTFCYFKHSNVSIRKVTSFSATRTTGTDKRTMEKNCNILKLLCCVFPFLIYKFGLLAGKKTCGSLLPYSISSNVYQWCVFIFLFWLTFLQIFHDLHLHSCHRYSICRHSAASCSKKYENGKYTPEGVVDLQVAMPPCVSLL